MSTQSTQVCIFLNKAFLHRLEFKTGIFFFKIVKIRLVSFPTENSERIPRPSLFSHKNVKISCLLTNINNFILLANRWLQNSSGILKNSDRNSLRIPEEFHGHLFFLTKIWWYLVCWQISTSFCWQTDDCRILPESLKNSGRNSSWKSTPLRLLFPHLKEK